MLAEALLGLLARAHRSYRLRLPGFRGLGVLERPLRWGVEQGLRPVIEDVRGISHYLYDSIVPWEILRKGEWEWKQSEFLWEVLVPGDVFVHVGANSGYYCVLGGRKVGVNGRVLGIEVQSPLCEIARSTAQLNGLTNVRVLEMGCWSSEQTAEIEERGDSVLASVRPGAGAVRLAPLDDVLRSENIEEVAVLMIDTEGADLEVLKGGVDCLERMRPVVIVEVDHLGRFGSTTADLMAFMEARGFSGIPTQSQYSLDYVFFTDADRERVLKAGQRLLQDSPAGLPVPRARPSA